MLPSRPSLLKFLWEHHPPHPMKISYPSTCATCQCPHLGFGIAWGPQKAVEQGSATEVLHCCPFQEGDCASFVHLPVSMPVLVLKGNIHDTPHRKRKTNCGLQEHECHFWILWPVETGQWKESFSVKCLHKLTMAAPASLKKMGQCEGWAWNSIVHDGMFCNQWCCCSKTQHITKASFDLLLKTGWCWSWTRRSVFVRGFKPRPHLRD